MVDISLWFLMLTGAVATREFIAGGDLAKAHATTAAMIVMAFVALIYRLVRKEGS
jgi:hypothetical protein